MSIRAVGLFLLALVAIPVSPALARHGGGHGGFGGGGAHFGGGGGRFEGGFGGGYHPMGTYHPSAPAFNRTPSFSMPRSFESPRFEGGGMRPEGFNAREFGRQPGFERAPMARPEFGPRPGGFDRMSVRNENINGNRFENRPAFGYQNRYLNYHRDWIHGYWNGHYPGGWGWRGGYGYPGYGYWGGYGGGLGYGGFGWGLGSGLGLGLGLGAGYGISSWLFGPMLYNWGYSSYANPYFGGTTVIQQPIVYDYSQPIDASASVPDEGPTNQAMATFEQARVLFQQGDYGGALNLDEQALATLANDPTLHEFRALALFALGRYDEAAAALYAVLSVGPGWDWSTLIRLYGDPEAYTQQLRALEAYVSQNRESAPARFVLAYHYLTEGHAEAAAAQYREVVRLRPSDRLSAQLLQQLQPPTPRVGATTTPPSAPAGTTPTGASGQPASAPSGNLTGTWTVQPAPDTQITVIFPDPEHFTWRVARQGQVQEFKGAASFVNGILTLAQDQANAMVGDVTWKDADHFKFTVLGGGPDDPGLLFTRGG